MRAVYLVRVAVLLGIGTRAALLFAAAEPARFSWTDPKAEVLPTGDLRWSPEPFAYQPGDNLRYIDYEHGGDANPGSRDQPWKHHPWDPNFQAGMADAKTTIEELYAWQFDGPFLRDFTGHPPIGRRDAGAIEAAGKP